MNGTPARVLAVGVEVTVLDEALVEHADDLLGALARLADEPFDVVLLSLELPDEAGPEAVRAVRERAPSVPVIAVTSGSDAERAIDAGASDALPTDASPELVRRAIRYATDLQRAEAELRRLQVIDEATGLYNARGFEQVASHHLALADRSKEPVILVFVRLDELEGGDADDRAGVLSETAKVLRGAVRDSDVVARVGVGAFCVLLTGPSRGAETIVLSRLVEAVAASNAEAGGGEQLSLSVGTAAYDPAHPMPLDELIAEAGRRMSPER